MDLEVCKEYNAAVADLRDVRAIHCILLRSSFRRPQLFESRFRPLWR